MVIVRCGLPFTLLVFVLRSARATTWVKVLAPRPSPSRVTQTAGGPCVTSSEPQPRQLKIHSYLRKPLTKQWKSLWVNGSRWGLIFVRFCATNAEHRQSGHSPDDGLRVKRCAGVHVVSWTSCFLFSFSRNITFTPKKVRHIKLWLCRLGCRADIFSKMKKMSLSCQRINWCVCGQW